MYQLSEDTFDQKEISSIEKLIRSKKKLSYGKNVKDLEKKISKFHNRKYAVMVNSGSSANLLGISSLLFDNKFNLNVGDEVIVPALSWSTTYSPLMQLGLKLVFVDINLETLNIDPSSIEKYISKNTKAIFAVNILGLSCNYQKINQIAKKHNLFIFEDNCESFGAIYKNKLTGRFGIFSTLSSYYSHHLCTIEGGFLLTDNFRLYCNALALRSHGWLREQPSNSHLNKYKYNNFEKLFKFVLPGYNLRPTELNAALGLIQINKIKNFIKNRRDNAYKIYKIFSNNSNIRMQRYDSYSSFFGFSLILQNKLINKRKSVINFMKKNKIENRPIVTGNILNNPMMRFAKIRKKGKYPNVSFIDQNGIMIGNRSRPINKKEIEILKNLNDFLLESK